WPRRRWLLVAATIGALGAGSLAVHDLFTTPAKQTTRSTKPRAGHPAARAARIRARARAVTSSRRRIKPAVAAHTASKRRDAAAHRKPRAPRRRTVHTHVAAAKTQESSKPPRTSHVRPHSKRNVASGPVHPRLHRHRNKPSSPIHPRPQTFAWVKVADAAGYRVALFESSGAILFRDTKTPRMIVPGTWRYGGKVHSLSPGHYRWYVWPLDGRGQPSTRAIVSSALVIGP